MHDIVLERIVKREYSRADRIMRIASTGICLIFMMLGAFFIGYLAAIIALILWFLMDRFYFKQIPVDFDYELHNQNLTFSIIRNGMEREKVVSLNLILDADVIAPRNHEKIRNIQPDQFLIYSPLHEDADTYAILYKKDRVRHCILFDPDEDMLDAMSNFTGSKLIRGEA